MIGIDVGGTKIAGGWLRLHDGGRGQARVISTAPQRGGAAVLESVRGLATELAAEATAAGLKIRGIGIGVCELVDRRGELTSANCIDWRGLPVRKTLSTVGPVVFEADVRAAALAEARLGSGRPYQIFLYVTVGTGISCCLMLAGKPYLGMRGLTGTMASSPIAVPCEYCGRMSRRTLEEIAAGPGLVTRYQAAGGKATTGWAVLAEAAAGNSTAQTIVGSGSEALESQVALLVNTLDPEAVVIGGGLGLSEGPYWDHFLGSIRRHIWSPIQRDLPIRRAATGADAGWIGAALKAADDFAGNTHNPQTHE